MAAPLQIEKLVLEKKALDMRIEAIKAEERHSVIEDIKNKIAIFGLSLEDLGFYIRSENHGIRHRVKTVAPKYRDPTTGATWSGRGKSPRWLLGKDREQFRIR